MLFGLGLGLNLFAADRTWNVDADGNWGDSSNWNPNNVPNGNSEDAILGNVVTATRTVTVASEKVGSLTLNANSGTGYIIDGTQLRLRREGSSGNPGIQQDGAGNVTFSADIKMLRDQTWSGNGTGVVTIDGVLKDDGSSNPLTKAGSFSLVLNSNNTFDDGFTLQAGSVTIGDSGAFGTGGLTLSGGTVSSSSALTPSNNVTVGGDFTIGGSNDLTFSGTVDLGTTDRTITVTNSGATEISGVVSNTAKLTKAGSGTLELSGSNSFSGGLSLDAGKVILSDTDAAGTGSTTLAASTTLELNHTGTATIDTITAAGGTIDRTIASATATRLLSDSGTRTLTVNGDMTLRDSGNTASGSLAIDGPITINNSGTTLTLDASGANSSVVLGGSQNITLAAGAELATTGSGTVTIGEGSARTIIGQGSGGSESTLTLGATSHSLNSLTGFQVNGSGTSGLTIQGSISTLDSVLVTGGNIQNISASGSGTLTLEATSTGTLTVDKGAGVPTPVKIGFDAANVTDYQFNIGDSGDSGTVDVFEDWGGLVVKGGTVRIQQDQSFTSTAGHDTTLEISGGKLVLGGDDLTFEGAITLTGGSLIGGDFGGQRGTLTGGGDVTLTGTTTSALLPKAALEMNPSSGTKSLSRTGGAEDLFHSLTKTGAGDVSITDSFDFSQVNIDSGTILLGADNVLVDNPSIVMKGGDLYTQGTDQSGLGTLNLTSSGILDLGSGGSVINFSDSTVAWSGGSQLTISSWSGSTSGGGSDQIIFGSDSSGLSAANLTKVVFQDPFGPGSGNYAAKILSTGEVVPVPEPATVLSTIAVIAAVAYRERRRIGAVVESWRS